MLGIVVHSHQVEGGAAAYPVSAKSPISTRLTLFADHSDLRTFGRLLQRLQQHAIVNAEKTGLHHDSRPTPALPESARQSPNDAVSRLLSRDRSPAVKHMEVAIAGGRAGDAA